MPKARHHRTQRPLPKEKQPTKLPKGLGRVLNTFTNPNPKTRIKV